MAGRLPRFQFTRRGRNIRNLEGPELARVTEDRDHELENYLEELAAAAYGTGGLRILGRVPTEGDLPSSGNEHGDGYLTDDPEDHLWIWMEPPGEWVDTGPFNVTEHDALAGVTANQHHPQAHDHNGDGSGAVAHASTIGQTPDDHHPQIHDLDSHSDVVSAAALLRHALTWNGSNWVPEYRMNWRGVWAVGATYEVSDVVLDGGYLAYANTQNTDIQPRPQETGVPVWLLPEIPTWNPLNLVGSVEYGLRITVPAGELWAVVGFRIWIDSQTTDDTTYQIVSYDLIAGTVTLGDSFPASTFFGQENTWVELPYASAPLIGGQDVVIAVAKQTSAAETLYNHPWSLTGINNTEADPGVGNSNRNQQNSVLRINNTDNNSDDRTAELRAVVPGSTIRTANESDLNRYYEYLVLSLVDNGTYVTYTVSLLDTGGAGAPLNELSQIYFTVPTPLQTDYVELPGAYTGSSVLQGVIDLGGGGHTFDDVGRGVDLEFQQYTISDEWDIMAISSSSSGGGGGGGGDFVPHVLNAHDDVATDAPINGQALIYNLGTGLWEPATLPSGVTDHALLSNIQSDDHHARYTDAEAQAANSGLWIPVGDAGNFVLKTGDTMTGPLLLPQGTVDAPALAWSDITAAGFYVPDLGISRIASSVPLLLPNGAAGAPALAFSGLPDTGLRHSGGDLIWESRGIEIARMWENGFRVGTGATGTALIPTAVGTVSAPAYSFSGDPDTGLYRVGADSIGFAMGGANRLTVSDLGRLSFNAATSEQIRLQGTSDSIRPYMSFYYQGGRAGYIGYPDATNLVFHSDNGGIKIGGDYLRIPGGSVGTPGLHFDSDTNTGLYSYGSDSLGFVTAGGVRMRLEAAALYTMGGTMIRVDAGGTATNCAYAFNGDSDTGMYRWAANQLAFAVGGVRTLSLGNTVQHQLLAPAGLTTEVGTGSMATLRFDSYDSTEAKGRFAGVAYYTKHSTDRHVLARVWSPGGDNLGYRNWENTAWVPLQASAFQIQSTTAEKARIRTARGERGLLNFAVAGERDLAFEQYRKLRPVFFDDVHQFRDRVWAGCDEHDTRDECARAGCAGDHNTITKQHICDDIDCAGTNKQPCWDIEQHVDRVGLIAEELAEIYPKAVPRMVGRGHQPGDHEHGGTAGYDPNVLHMETINVVQFLIDENEALKARLDALEGA